MRLAAYGTVSTLLATGIVTYAFHQRANFYSACVYLGQSNACLMILCNFGFFLTILFGTFIQKIFYGPLRATEIEHLHERAWFAVTETCLAMTIFREEFDKSFIVMFTALLFLKCFHWLGSDRVDFMEQTPPPNPALFHTRLASSLLLLLVTDVLLTKYCVSTLFGLDRPNMTVMFAFEFAILTISCSCVTGRYILGLVERFIVSKRINTARVRIQASIRRRIEAGELEADDEAEVLEDELNEGDLGAWDEKGTYVFYLELVTDLLKLLTYMLFFFIVLSVYGLPFHIIRDIYLTIRSFITRIRDFIRFRRATAHMDARYPDATAEEVGREGVCIICREEMVAWTEPTEGADVAEHERARHQRSRPKKLPCNHVLHYSCLRSWLERQQRCPTCRRPVLDDTNPSPTMVAAGGGAAAAGAGAAGGAGAGGAQPGQQQQPPPPQPGAQPQLPQQTPAPQANQQQPQGQQGQQQAPAQQGRPGGFQANLFGGGLQFGLQFNHNFGAQAAAAPQQFNQQPLPQQPVQQQPAQPAQPAAGANAGQPGARGGHFGIFQNGFIQGIADQLAQRQQEIAQGQAQQTAMLQGGSNPALNVHMLTQLHWLDTMARNQHAMITQMSGELRAMREEVNRGRSAETGSSSSTTNNTTEGATTDTDATRPTPTRTASAPSPRSGAVMGIPGLQLPPGFSVVPLSVLGQTPNVGGGSSLSATATGSSAVPGDVNLSTSGIRRRGDRRDYSTQLRNWHSGRTPAVERSNPLDSTSATPATTNNDSSSHQPLSTLNSNGGSSSGVLSRIDTIAANTGSLDESGSPRPMSPSAAVAQMMNRRSASRGRRSRPRTPTDSSNPSSRRPSASPSGRDMPLMDPDIEALLSMQRIPSFSGQNSRSRPNSRPASRSGSATGFGSGLGSMSGSGMEEPSDDSLGRSMDVERRRSSAGEIPLSETDSVWPAFNEGANGSQNQPGGKIPTNISFSGGGPTTTVERKGSISSKGTSQFNVVPFANNNDEQNGNESPRNSIVAPPPPTSKLSFGGETPADEGNEGGKVDKGKGRASDEEYDIVER